MEATPYFTATGIRDMFGPKFTISFEDVKSGRDNKPGGVHVFFRHSSATLLLNRGVTCSRLKNFYGTGHQNYRKVSAPHR
jgi:hypothetical protein